MSRSQSLKDEENAGTSGSKISGRTPIGAPPPECENVCHTPLAWRDRNNFNSSTLPPRSSCFKRLLRGNEAQSGDEPISDRVRCVVNRWNAKYIASSRNRTSTKKNWKITKIQISHKDGYTCCKLSVTVTAYGHDGCDVLPHSSLCHPTVTLCPTVS